MIDPKNSTKSQRSRKGFYLTLLAIFILVVGPAAYAATGVSAL